MGEYIGFGLMIAIFPAIFAGALAGTIEILTRARRMKGRKPVSHKKRFPMLKRLIQAGWWYGDRPKGILAATSTRLDRPVEVDLNCVAQILPEADESVSRSIVLIVAAFLLCIVGAGLVVWAVFIVLHERGSFIGVSMAGGAMGLAVAAFGAAAAMFKKTGLLHI
jgi:hypothetical protein